jgi:nitrate reductase delta subunit
MTNADWNRLADTLAYPENGAAPLQEAYVQAFDLDPACSLDIGWHLYGDRPERGAFLVMLRERMADAGLDEDGNLPDYLPTLLRLIGRQDAQLAAALAALIAPAASRVLERLRLQENPFAAPLEAAVRALEEARQQEAHS